VVGLINDQVMVLWQNSVGNHHVGQKKCVIHDDDVRPFASSGGL